MTQEQIKECREEELAQQLHKWYLEATKRISKLSFNPKAQRSYTQLTNEQKYIDRYIAGKVLGELEKKEAELTEKNKQLDSLHETCNNYENTIEIQKAELEKEGGMNIKEPYQRKPSNHLECNLIAVGYYKHEIDFGVRCNVGELSQSEFDKLFEMLEIAKRVANDMWDRNHSKSTLESREE